MKEMKPEYHFGYNEPVEWWDENSNEASEGRDYVRGVETLQTTGSYVKEVKCNIIYTCVEGINADPLSTEAIY